MRNTWTSIVGLGACSVLGVLLLSDASWAKPKKSSYVTCKCTCEAEDVLGKIHYGEAQFTESSDDRCLFHKCTVGSQRLEGTTRNCSVTEHPASMRLPPGFTPGVLQQATPTPGGMRAPTTGTIMPRGIEGDPSSQPAAEAPNESAPAQPEPVDRSGETKSP
jgi:hypothetical protein